MSITGKCYTNNSLKKGWRGRRKLILAVAFICLTEGARCTTVTNLNDLGELNISQGESVIFTQIVENVTVSGEQARVTANFKDTSVLAAGQHRLVYTAITLSGRTAVKTTFLNVDTASPQTQQPTISGVTNATFTETRRFDLLRTVAAYSSSGEPVVCRATLPSEQLAPGNHSIYFTAVDNSGHSVVTNCSVTVLPLSDSFRRAEWNRLGKALYEKYFEPARLAPYFTSNTKVYSVFVYGEVSTQPGISAHISFRDVSFDMLSFGQHPMKVEALTARMVAFLKELQHHRRFWFDQPYIIFSVDVRAEQSDSGERKERGLYSVRIPNAVFQREDFDEVLLAAFRSMPSAELRSRSDNKGKVCHALYEDPTSQIRILFEVDLIEGFAWNFTSRWKNGEVTLEENFDAELFAEAYAPVLERFNQGDFGAFSDPVLPFIKSANPNP